MPLTILYFSRIAKRAIDLICSLLLLVIASPFMLVTAIAIKLYDDGPVFYKQIRCTLGQRELTRLHLHPEGELRHVLQILGYNLRSFRPGTDKRHIPS